MNRSQKNCQKMLSNFVESSNTPQVPFSKYVCTQARTEGCIILRMPRSKGINYKVTPAEKKMIKKKLKNAFQTVQSLGFISSASFQNAPPLMNEKLCSVMCLQHTPQKIFCQYFVYLKCFTHKVKGCLNSSMMTLLIPAHASQVLDTRGELDLFGLYSRDDY